MRIGKPLEHAQAAVKSLDVADPVIKFTALGRQLGYAGYLFNDMLVWVRFSSLLRSFPFCLFPTTEPHSIGGLLGALYESSTLDPTQIQHDPTSGCETLVHWNLVLPRQFRLQVGRVEETSTSRFEAERGRRERD